MTSDPSGTLVERYRVRPRLPCLRPGLYSSWPFLSIAALVVSFSSDGSSGYGPGLDRVEEPYRADSTKTIFSGRTILRTLQFSPAAGAWSWVRSCIATGSRAQHRSKPNPAHVFLVRWFCRLWLPRSVPCSARTQRGNQLKHRLLRRSTGSDNSRSQARKRHTSTLRRRRLATAMGWFPMILIVFLAGLISIPRLPVDAARNRWRRTNCRDFRLRSSCLYLRRR